MRRPLLALLLLSPFLLAACGQVVTGPRFKEQLAPGQAYFGEVYSPVTFTAAAPIKVETSPGQGFFLVTALDGSLYSYDLQQGKRREKRPWAKLPKGVRATPHLDLTQRQLVLGCYDRQVHALDMVSGALRWAARVDGYVQAPVVQTDGTLVVGTLGGTVYGLAGIDGSVRWRTPVNAEVYGAAGVNPLWPHRALIGTAQGDLFLLNTENGEVLGQQSAGHGLHAGPAVTVVGGDVRAFFGTDGSALQCWRLPDGSGAGKFEKLWTADAGGEVWATPAVAPEVGEITSYQMVRVYAVSNASKVLALSAQDGTILWETAIEPVDRMHGTPLVIEPYLYVGSHNHHLYCLERQGGTIVWDFESFGEFRTRPLLDDGRLISVSNDHFLYAVTWDKGEPIIGSMSPPPAPRVLDLTQGLPSAEAPGLPLDESFWEEQLQAELAPVVADILTALQNRNAARLAELLDAPDPLRQSAYATAALERFTPFTLQQHALRAVIPATPSDAVVVLNVQALQDGAPVRMVLTLRLQKDAARDPAWRVEPVTLKPETVLPVPTLVGEE